jgi:zinc/manganese transport system permease protein
MSLSSVDLVIIGPALVAGLVVLATHVPMGMQVLRRGIVFIDLAIAQIAGLGVIAADALGLEPQGWGVQVSALSAALAGALVLTWTERLWPEVQEALIGVLFVLAASAGLLLLANNPHGGEHLKDLLVGQILWVSYPQLLPAALLTALILGLWLGPGRRMGAAAFYLLFAGAVTVSVQLVGIYLVFSSLIVPALACRHYPPGLRLYMGYGLGVAGYAMGLLLSALYDLPSGAVIVLSLVLLAIPVYGLGPRPAPTGSAPKAMEEGVGEAS